MGGCPQARLQDAEIAGTAYRDRELAHYYDHDGCLVIKARLPAEQGALVVKALEMAMEQDFRDGSPEVAGTEGDVTAVTSVREAGVKVTAVTSHLEGGPHVPAQTSRRICCDSSISHLLKQASGEPLSIGRRSRTIPPPMRRALQARDGGCRFPGCTHTRFVDGHHIKHWADGGETSLNNLILLCRHHHRLVHEGGFHCEERAGGELVFKDRSDDRLPGYWALPGVAAADLKRWLDTEFFEPGIQPDACVTKWRGERMDYQKAVSGLMT